MAEFGLQPPHGEQQNTTNRLYSIARYERLIQETDWSLFVDTTGEYDEFEDFNFRVTSHAGVGYWWFEIAQRAR